jgi:glycosyltransferase involved in cell wall biosynthesis
VGALNEHKGVPKIIDAFLQIQSDQIGDIHFVGDGHQKEEFIKKAKKLSYNFIFHGFLPKDKIQEIYKKAHFILLPSKSEGFPKVIGEGMNFGCIPIVSDISCIGDYVKHKENGYLIEKPISTNHLVLQIKESLTLENEVYLKWIAYNFKIAEKFTYSYYNRRVKNEIFKIE